MKEKLGWLVEVFLLTGTVPLFRLICCLFTILLNKINVFLVTIGFWPQVAFGWLLLPAPIPGRLPWPGVVDQRHQGHHLGRWNGQRCGRCWGSFGEAPGAQGTICFYSLRWGWGGEGGVEKRGFFKIGFFLVLFVVVVLRKEPYCFLVYLCLIASRSLLVWRLGLLMCLEHVVKAWEIWGLNFVVDFDSFCPSWNDPVWWMG